MPPWTPEGAPDLTGYEAPPRDIPAATIPLRPTVTVLGTVRDEGEALARSWEAWSQQALPAWLSVEYLVLDEGSRDHVGRWCAERRAEGHPIRYVRTRPPGQKPERSCTLAMNAAIRQLVRSPLVLIQWWDRIPGSRDHLRALVEPHRLWSGIATSAIARHVGGSSSCADLEPDQLRARLDLVPWREDPRTLSRIAGPIGAHCVPGSASESAGLCIPVDEFVALGGFDERYIDRASYVNVEFFRRLLTVGVPVLFVDEPTGANYHQSHPCPGDRKKAWGWLSDRQVRRNPGDGWGRMPLEADPL